MKVLLGVPHALLREGLRDVLKRWSVIKVIGAAPSAAEAARLVGRLRPDILVLSRGDSPTEDAQAISAVRSESVDCKVILVENVGRRGRRDGLGADRRLSASVGPAGLIRTMCELCEEAEDSTDAPGRGPTAEPRQLLTGREYEVARAVCEGLPNKLIARRLGISEKTVKNHLSSIYRRTKVSSRTQLAVWAMRRGLIDDLSSEDT